MLPAVETAGARIWRHPQVRELYPAYLVQTHGIIRASVPLLEAARDRARALAGDPVAAMVADYCDGHADEERGHDEWLLEDLASLGVDPDDVRTRPPSPTVAALVGAQYYWIHHVHPVGLLGYVLLLEGWPPARATIDELRVRTGFPAEAFRTLLDHADLDPHHGEELDEVLDALPLRPEQRTLLGVSALTSAQMFTDALRAVLLPGSTGTGRRTRDSARGLPTAGAAR